MQLDLTTENFNMDTKQTIRVTFTEADRINALEYTYNHDCLLATALKRMGFKASVGGSGRATINGEDFYPAYKKGDEFRFRGKEIEVKVPYKDGFRRFYKKSVVGKTLTLKKWI